MRQMRANDSRGGDGVRSVVVEIHVPTLIINPNGMIRVFSRSVALGLSPTKDLDLAPELTDRSDAVDSG
ncbi:MAG: hypothetical protein O7B81_08620 [Gammaproteobacteria bacterium]|nr:hypothetical protein [Gammaproteobacteria bacterium]MCZ6893903.1 hypothetical protein [Gammaproteobacteria bacterium]